MGGYRERQPLSCPIAGSNVSELLEPDKKLSMGAVLGQQPCHRHLASCGFSAGESVARLDSLEPLDPVPGSGQGHILAHGNGRRGGSAVDLRSPQCRTTSLLWIKPPDPSGASRSGRNAYWSRCRSRGRALPWPEQQPEGGGWQTCCSSGSRSRPAARATTANRSGNSAHSAASGRQDLEFRVGDVTAFQEQPVGQGTPPGR